MDYRMNYPMIKTYQEDVRAGVSLPEFRAHFDEMYVKYHHAKTTQEDTEYAEASAMFGMAIVDAPDYLKTLSPRRLVK